MAQPQTQRIPGIDAWRAILMLFGVAYHGTMLKTAEVPFFLLIVHVSQSCRMGVFFALSGFLAAHALLRHKPSPWIKERLASLGTVTAFGLIVLCPITSVTALIAPDGNRIAHHFPQWYHIWFLVALLLYTPVAYLLHSLDVRDNSLERWGCGLGATRYAQPLLLTITPIISLFFMRFTDVIVLRTASPSLFWQLWQLRLVTGYLPMFVLGFVLARSPKLLQAATRSALFPGAIVMTMGACYIVRHTFSAEFVGGAGNLGPDELFLGVGSAICPPSVLILVMRSALAIRTAQASLKRLADASFTIYLVHLPIVVAINGMFAWVNWNEIVEWAVAVTLTVFLSLGIHERFVRRSALARLLFNGERPRPMIKAIRV